MNAKPTSAKADGVLDPRVARSRARVLDAATQLLVEGGPSALTVDAIAATSSVAKSTLYRHWSSIDDLVVDVLRHNLETTHVPDGVEGFEASLRALMGAIATRASEPEWQRILPALFTLKQHVSAIETIAEDDQNEQLNELAKVVDLGIAEGRLPADIDVEFAMFQLMGPIVLATIAVGGDAPLQLVDRVVDRFLASWA
ncbi:MAG: TetR/AcrR family transcriptional regulator [Acidimicrobiales bacterium]